jgi:GT2 family glycosyltransferase
MTARASSGFGRRVVVPGLDPAKSAVNATRVGRCVSVAAPSEDRYFGNFAKLSTKSRTIASERPDTLRLSGLSVIVPFHRNVAHLTRCLQAICAALDGTDLTTELVVVADGAPDDCSALVHQMNGTLLSVQGPSGPAVARNRGAAATHKSLLLFVDADVAIEPAAVRQLLAVFRTEPDVAAVFGAYDEEPDDRAFVSQARNLAHSFVHQRSRRDAQTFWAGLGAVRADAFTGVGGFDERFTRPSVEDIDLGYRLRAAGNRIVLDHTIRGKHLKQWSFWSALRTDVVDRGIPWTQLLCRYSAMQDDLNVSRAYRACVMISYAALICAAGAFWRPVLVWPGIACLLALVALDWPCYRFFARRRGLLFTARWYPLHVVHHLSNGLSFMTGTCLFVLSRTVDARWPGALPADKWRGRTVSSCTIAVPTP